MNVLEKYLMLLGIAKIVVTLGGCITKWSEGTASWPDQACNPRNSFGYCDTNDQDHANAWAKYVCGLNGYSNGEWTGNKKEGCAGETSVWCQGKIPCNPRYETSCWKSDQTQIEVECCNDYDCITDCEGKDDGNYHSCLSCNVYATCWGGGYITDNRPCASPQPGDPLLEYDSILDACVFPGESQTCHGYEGESAKSIGALNDLGNNFNDITGITGNFKNNNNNNNYYGYIMLIGLIAFILMSNIFIGCWC
eukprot:548293_1